MLSYKDIAKIFEEIEIRLISSLKRNLTRHKNEEKQYNMNWSAWQAEKLRNLDKFRQENSFIMKDYTKIIDSETRQIMLDEFTQGMNGINYPGDSEISKEPQFFGVDKVKVNKLIDDVVNLEKHAETAALRTMDDVYRQTVNKVQLAMSSGSMTLQQAIDIAVQDFLNKGINCIEYRNGRRVNIADYVRMALRTTATRANLQGQSEKIKALGYDTILISSYSMCSEPCLPWQGRVYINDVFVMWDGKIEQRGEILYGKSNYCGKWFPLLSSAIQGGLFHPNCRHTLLMWRDGDPIPKPVDNSDNNRRYKLEQHQRLLENNVRKAKRFVAGQTDPSNIKKAKAELINSQKRLREFIQQTNISENETVLKRDYGREKVYQNENLQNGLTYAKNSDKIKVPETLADYEKAKILYMEKIKNTEIMKPKNKETVEKALKTLIDNGDFCMRVNKNSLENIIEDKRFKTQIETGISGGTYNPDLRKKATEILFGADSSKIPNNAYEKYGFLTEKDKSITFLNGDADNYGNIIVQFKKENLFNRTTYTIGDSLNNISNKSLIFAGKVSEPSVCAVPLDKFTNTIIQASKDFNNNSINTISKFCEKSMVDYIELQYHGELTFNDIEIIHYQDSIDENLKKSLEKSGIKVKKVE